MNSGIAKKNRFADHFKKAFAVCWRNTFELIFFGPTISRADNFFVGSVQEIKRYSPGEQMTKQNWTNRVVLFSQQGQVFSLKDFGARR